MFPLVAPPEGWDALRADHVALAPGVAAIAQRHGLRGAAVHRYDSGSLPVYALGESHVLKLFPPDQAEFASVEARVLSFVASKLPLPTPEVVASATLDGWFYIVMTQLRGRRAVEVWPELSSDERDRFAGDLGHGLAALHRLDAAALVPLAPHWDEFVAAQTASAVERQRKRGLAPVWLEQIPAFLQAWKPAVDAPKVLLHTEVMREHLMVELGPRGWRLSGLFDFEPAMRGDAAYEFASVGLFAACGEARLLRRILLAYGFADSALNDALSCRFMAHALLHRYSNLPWYMRRLPLENETTLEQLAQRWWAMTL